MYRNQFIIGAAKFGRPIGTGCIITPNLLAQKSLISFRLSCRSVRRFLSFRLFLSFQLGHSGFHIVLLTSLFSFPAVLGWLFAGFRSLQFKEINKGRQTEQFAAFAKIACCTAVIVT
jgi:hypothetical protein